VRGLCSYVRVRCIACMYTNAQLYHTGDRRRQGLERVVNPAPSSCCPPHLGTLFLWRYVIRVF
jgi:hypothetical protein